MKVQSFSKSHFLQVMISGLLFVVLLLGSMLPLLAQDTTVDENVVIATGPVEFNANREIVVGGYIIAPASAFTPSTLQTGDVVIIIGRLLPDGVTVQAQSFEFFEEPEVTEEPEMTEEPEVTAEPEVTEEPEVTAEPEVTEEPVATCGNGNHPVATRIAEQFAVSYDEVMSMHCAGNGFGNIIRAYMLAEAGAEGANAQDFLDRAQGGEGWGQIMRESGVHPSQLAPGQAMRGNNGNNGNGNGNGAGNPNAGNGRGNNGNGNGNGNGNNGNRGNNGNGNGNGNGGGGKGRP